MTSLQKNGKITRKETKASLASRMILESEIKYEYSLQINLINSYLIYVSSLFLRQESIIFISLLPGYCCLLNCLLLCFHDKYYFFKQYICVILFSKFFDILFFYFCVSNFFRVFLSFFCRSFKIKDSWIKEFSFIFLFRYDGWMEGFFVLFEVTWLTDCRL